jgi:hypothetical protein
MELIDMLITTTFQRSMLESDENRRQDAADFAAFLDNDYDEIVKILKRETLNKPYSSDTQTMLRWRHIDIINKTLNRKIAGIFDNEPKITLGEDEKENEKLAEILTSVDFVSKVKRAVKRASFFNTLIAMPVMRDGEFEIDVIDPQYFIVVPKANYYKIDKIAIQRTDEDNNVYWLIFSEDENYIISGNDNRENIPIDEEKDNEGKNSYGIIPVAVCRIKENGCDFYGEPNWNLYRAQIETDARLTDIGYIQWMQSYGVWVFTNIPVKDGQTLTPGQIVTATKVKSDDAQPSVSFVSPSIDWTGIRDNIDWEIERVLNAEGIPNTSASVSGESPKQVGAKTIDEIELQEQREDLKTVTYKFIIDLLNVFRVVWNAHNPGMKLNEKEVFECEFSEEKPFESIQDKIARRNMEKENFIGDAITFVMEDKEISEQEAIDHVKKIKERSAELGLNGKQDTPIGGVASRILGRT